MDRRRLLALLAGATLLQHLRFGYGSALATVVFLAGFLLAWLAVRALGGFGREAR